MKKIIFGLIVLSLIFAASCSKRSNTLAGGSWTFEGNTYTVTNCEGEGNRLVASNSTNNNANTFGNLAITFAGTSLPTVSGTYTVVDTTPLANQVNIYASIGGVYDTVYTATGGGGNQTISVNVTNGVITASGSNIEILYNAGGLIDSNVLSFNVHTAGKQ